MEFPSQKGEVGQLHQAASVAPAQPDFISAATGRFEGNLISIGRELRTTFSPRGRYELIGSTGRNQRVEMSPPDVLVPSSAAHRPIGFL